MWLDNKPALNGNQFDGFPPFPFIEFCQKFSRDVLSKPIRYAKPHNTSRKVLDHATLFFISRMIRPYDNLEKDWGGNTGRSK